MVPGMPQVKSGVLCLHSIAEELGALSPAAQAALLDQRCLLHLTSDLLPVTLPAVLEAALQGGGGAEPGRADGGRALALAVSCVGTLLQLAPLRRLASLGALARETVCALFETISV